ncbi:Ribosome maturation protein SDO1 [Candidatus Gugararchaeum adminiculabundum]|nr:Ribosome maturation protein SDO1 [Candidatus Gugararchaeum adminiculabundum]
MASLDTALVARLDYGGKRFEILVDPKLGYDYKVGKKKDLLNILVVEEVFENARKGERHKSEDVKKAFGTEDIYKIAEVILQKGDLALTTEQKRELLEEKTKKIVAIIARECINPQTGAPHPPQRIENAMNEARVHVDPFKAPEAQLEGIVSALRPLLPLKFEHIKVAVRVPPEFAQRSYGVLKERGIQKEEWQKDGSLIAVVEMPAGLQGEFYDRINKLTSGKVETKVIK